MDEAMEAAGAVGAVSKACAFDYRDGLMIALLSAIPIRRRTFAALRIGTQLVRSGKLWTLEVGAEHTKNRRELDFAILAQLSARIDLYLEKFRKSIPDANAHDGLWASNKSRAMDHGSIYDMVRRRTRKAFGFSVNLHRFRHAAVTFWSIHDPRNVRGAKDLLGHASFATTEKHYIMAQSRIAGRALARIVDQSRGKGTTELRVIYLREEIPGQHNAQALPRFLKRQSQGGVHQGTGRRQVSDLGDRGHRLLQDLQALRDDFVACIDADTRKVASGMR